MSVSNSMVAHKWAHGQASNGSNFMADADGKLYSYSTLVGFNTGRGLVFLSASSLTPSTGKQLSYARRAVSHLHVVSSLVFKYGRGGWGEFNEAEAFQAACVELNGTLLSLSTAPMSKHLAWKIDRALDLMDDLNAIARHYGFDEFVYTSLVTDRLPAARAYAEQFEVKAAAAQVKRLASARERDAKTFEAWRAGEGVACPSSFRLDAQGGYYLAVRGDKVVTSGGVECPTEHARIGLAFWSSRKQGDGPACVFELWQRNGHQIRLGVFQLDKIDAAGNAYAGCHKFTAEELNRLAEVLHV